MTDIGSMILKEWRELFGQRGLRGKSGVALFVLVFGVLLPLQNGSQWITSPAIAIVWSWAPMFLIVNIIADAFAGERERHTLETLLASRLPDSAILFGKMGAAIIYGGAVTAVCLLLGVGAVNIVDGSGGFVVYAPSAVLVMVVLGFLGAMFVAALGVLVSLRAATVRQAQQTLNAVIIVLLFVPVGIVRMLPAAWKAYLPTNAIDGARLAVVAVVAFALLGVGVTALAMARFTRARLITN